MAFVGTEKSLQDLHYTTLHRLTESSESAV